MFWIEKEKNRQVGMLNKRPEAQEVPCRYSTGLYNIEHPIVKSFHNCRLELYRFVLILQQKNRDFLRIFLCLSQVAYI